MARLSWRRILAVALGIGCGSWVVNFLIVRNGSPMPISWFVSVALVFAAAAALALGWEVKQYREGKRPGLSPFQAARTAVFAQAAALTGAALIGLYGGYMASLLGDWGHAPRRALALTALLAIVASGLLCAAGWVAERWCALDGDDKDEFHPGASPEAA